MTTSSSQTSTSRPASGPDPVDPPSTPDTGTSTAPDTTSAGSATDPYARRRDDWPEAIVNPDYSVPAPRR